jgi:L-rhamnose mutarotase
MTRVGFVMELKPGTEETYRQKHDEIWPEMVETLHRFGIHNYTIYRRGQTLFVSRVR